MNIYLPENEKENLINNVVKEKFVSKKKFISYMKGPLHNKTNIDDRNIVFSNIIKGPMGNINQHNFRMSEKDVSFIEKKLHKKKFEVI